MDIRGRTKPNFSADTILGGTQNHGDVLRNYFLGVRVKYTVCLCPGCVPVRVVSVQVVSLSGLCPCPGCVCPGCVLSRLRPVQVVSCPGYVPVRVVSVRVVSVRVASCPGCVCPGYVVAPPSGLALQLMTK